MVIFAVVSQPKVIMPSINFELLSSRIPETFEELCPGIKIHRSVESMTFLGY